MLPLNELRAAAIFASTDMTRYILNGVYVQIDKHGQVTLAATDGRRACIIESEARVASPCEVAAFIVPLRLIKRAIPVRKSQVIEMRAEPIGEVQLTGTQSARTRYTITLSDGETAVSGKSVDGAYPKYAQVLPGKIAAGNTRIAIAPKFLADLSAASKLLKPASAKHYPAIVFGGESETKAITALIDGVSKFYSIVMPVHVDELASVSFGAPAWTKVDVLAPEVEAAIAVKIGGGA